MIPWHQIGTCLLFATVVYPMWVTGGTQTAWQFPLAILATALLAITLKMAGRQLWRDPLLPIGGLFLLLLVIQWINSNRELVFDPLIQAWIYEQPAIPWLPSSVKRPEAAEMLRWFFPTWVIVLAARHLLRQRAATRTVLMQSVLIAAAILAAGSMIQFAIATYWGIGNLPSQSYFIASFGYGNHAGSFFMLCFCIALGNTFSALYHHPSRQRQVTGIICSLLCLGGVLVSLSRAAILLSLAAGVVAVFYVLLAHRSTGGRAAIFDRILIAVAAIIAVFLLFQPIVGKSVTNELMRRNRSMENASLPANWTHSALEETRVLYRTVAIDILRDYPWFGAGGWSVRHLGVMYLPANQHRRLQTDGAANTHHDLLQFLSEFGVVGVGLLLAAVGVLAAPLVRNHRLIILSPRIFFRIVGLIMVLIHSTVDLPFRSPAVLYLWTLTLALASQIATGERLGKAEMLKR